jgi:hypothetical protein
MIKHILFRRRTTGAQYELSYFARSGADSRAVASRKRAFTQGSRMSSEWFRGSLANLAFGICGMILLFSAAIVAQVPTPRSVSYTHLTLPTKA